MRNGTGRCCKDCANCDPVNMKCHPKSKDCMPEYDLEPEDLTHYLPCDFFKAIEKGD